MFRFILLACTLSLATVTIQAQTQPWIIDTQSQWTQACDSSTNLVITDGLAEPNQDAACFQSILKSFPTKCKAQNITFTQSPVWDNWTQVADIAPPGAKGAPVFLPVSDKNYWFFAKESDGYHAWHSTDLKNWTRQGLVCTSGWVTDAEFVPDSNGSSAPLLNNKRTAINLASNNQSSGKNPKGKFYIYYDQPNDEDPHLVIDSDPTDDQPGREYGMVLNDPSFGSDCGIFRDDDGVWHMFYEDWTPINARAHSWDSPLGGRTESPDGIHGFAPHIYPDDRQSPQYLQCPPPIDQRTTPTGQSKTYLHQGDTYSYQEHLPEQNAYGDFSIIKIGLRYYMFTDFDPADGRKIRVGRWTSTDIRKPFTFLGEIGDNVHPDPSVGFAEGKFYVVAETTEYDFQSPGPWVDSVEARIGVDTDNDQTIDTWTSWQTITEKYSQKTGYTRIINVQPAQLDLSALPQGYNFKFEFKTTDTTDNKSKPIIDKVVMSFK